ncbi:MAG TPA: DNA internalization-related competence protein ComEC/Rec2 [Bdellovibrionota bacterium]|nr:DNA internalization-related competence protein ComEC/Rec2 [Bdellovibrionota bacterium]
MPPKNDFLSRLPILPYCVSYAFGIVLSDRIGGTWILIAVFVLLLLGIGAWFLKRSLVTTFLLVFVAMLIGAERAHNQNVVRYAPGSSAPPQATEAQIYDATVESYPERSEAGYRFRALVHSWQNDGNWEPLEIHALLSMRGFETPERGESFRFRARLRTPRNFGNDREFDFERYARTRSIGAVGAIADDQRWVPMATSMPPLWKMLNWLRWQASERADFFLSHSNAALFKSLVLGDRGDISKGLERAFRGAGILHILVVSGFQVALMAAVGSLLAGFLWSRSVFLVSRVPIWFPRAMGGAIGAVVFCLLTDLPVPTVRSLAAVLLGGLLLLFGRSRDPFAIWLAAAFGVLLVSPLYLFDVSAQLSFLAVLGILLGVALFPAPPKKKPDPLHRILLGCRSLGIATLGAIFATLPVVLYHFAQITLWSPLGNLIFVPTLGGIATPLGFLAMFVCGPFRPLGDFLMCVLGVWLDLWIPWVERIGSWPASDLWVPYFSEVSCLGYAVLFILVLAWKGQRIQSAFLNTAMALTGVLLSLYSPVVDGWLRHKGVDEIHVFHVGQGDATLIRSRTGKTVLVDAGPGGGQDFDAGDRILVPWFRKHNVRTISLLVLTHADSDHIGGAKSVIEQADVRKIWFAGFAETPVVLESRSVALKRNVPWETVGADTAAVTLDDVRVTPIHPPKRADHLKSENNRSLIVTVDIDGYRALMAADLEADGERDLLRRKVLSHADFLKVPHHGSRTSSTDGFLAVVHPSNAIITAGFGNRFHHPSPEVVERLMKYGARVWRGDECGEIITRIGNGRAEMTSVRPCRRPTP